MNTVAITPATIASLIVAIGFAAGLNVYATVCTLGVVARLHWIVLPGELSVLGHGWIIAVSGALFLLEVFADKIPGFDLIWNALHTFIRIPVAALLAYAASAHLSPEQKLVATLLGGVVAAVAHSSKMAARVLVTPSPEPVSNIALSSVEDVGAIGLTWVATRHPLAAGISVGALSTGLLVALWFTFGRVRASIGRLRQKRREA